MATRDTGNRDRRKIRQSIAFIGAGNMAEALISGLSALADPGSITAADVRSERLEYLRKKYGISTHKDNTGAIRRSDVIFLAVKPQQLEPVLLELGPEIRRSQLVISIAAGITTSFIEQRLPSGTPVIRTMPNTPALLGAGAVVLCRGRAARDPHAKLAARLFSAVGMAVELPEKHLNAVTALSGSGPAYVFYLCEAMEEAGRAMGLPADIASRLARRTVFGAGLMLERIAEPAAKLRENVTSPGGTTEAAIKYFESRKCRSLVAAALERARKRAGELSR